MRLTIRSAFGLIGVLGIQAATGWLFIFPTFPQGTPPDLPLTAERLSERVVIYRALDVNVTALAGRAGLAIIDTNRSPIIMAAIKKKIERDFGRSDVLYVINTHGHYDHCAGNQVFPGVLIIGEEGCPGYMRQNPGNDPLTVSNLKHRLSSTEPKSEAVLKEVAAWKTAIDGLEDSYVVTPPSKTFRGQMRLDLGGLTLELIACGDAHTDHDLFVHVPEEHLVWTGDVFTSPRNLGFPVNRLIDVPRLISTLDQLQNDDRNLRSVVPGHGEVLSAEDLLRLRGLLKERYEALDGRDSAVLSLRKILEESGTQQARRTFDEMKKDAGHGYDFSEDEFTLLGQRLLGRGRIDDAVAVFTFRVEMFPDSAIAYDNLGRALWKKGDIDGAIKNYEHSLQILPENLNAREALKCLRQMSALSSSPAPNS